jgi:hypothetical protein
MAVTMKNAVFWDVMPCGSCKNRRFGVTYHLHCHQGDDGGDMSPPPETLVLTRATWRHIPEDSILHSLFTILCLILSVCKPHFCICL